MQVSRERVSARAQGAQLLQGAASQRRCLGQCDAVEFAQQALLLRKLRGAGQQPLQAGVEACQARVQATLVATLQNFTAKAIDALTNRLGAVDSFTAESKADRSALSARLTALERNTDGLQKLKEDFAGFMGGARAHQERVESDISRLNNGVEGMQRQIGQLAIHGPGQLVELPGTSRK